jgi:hypothetical protein
MGAIVAGLVAVCLSSTNMGYGVGLFFIAAGFTPAVVSGPRKTVKTMGVMAWAGLMIVVAMVSGTIALNVVCIHSLAVGAGR